MIVSLAISGKSLKANFVTNIPSWFCKINSSLFLYNFSFVTVEMLFTDTESNVNLTKDQSILVSDSQLISVSSYTSAGVRLINSLSQKFFLMKHS